MEKIISKKERDSNFELLRCILMFMIIFLHMFVHGVNGEIVSFRNGESFPTTLTESFFLIFCMVSVNCYVMISGWFGIKITKRKIFNSYLPVLFYSVFIACIFFVLDRTNLKELVISFFPVSQVTYWFATCYLVLLLLSPYLNLVCEKYYDSKNLYVLLFLLCLVTWTPRLFTSLRAVTGLQSLGLSQIIICYMVGRILHLLVINKNLKLFKLSKIFDFILYFGFSMLTFFGVVIFYFLTKKNFWFALSAYASPLTMLASIYLILGFSKIDIGKKRVINTISCTTFGIYLIHENPFMRPIIYNFFHAYDLKHSLFLIPYVLVSSIVVFLGCSLIDFCRIKIFSVLHYIGEKK